MGRRSGFRLFVASLAVLAGGLLPATAAAHPLGNFTINHYAGLAISPDRIDLDIVIDMAEIPAFQERQRMDGDQDGSVSDDEATAWAATACEGLVKHLVVERDNVVLATVPGASTAAFPPGAGGLSTLRLECAFRVALTPILTERPSRITFADTSYLERIGWREVVATGAGAILDTHGLPATSPSDKLTAYPADLLSTPLDIRGAEIDARLDPAAPASTAPSGPASGPASAPPAAPISTPGIGAVPGGVAAELPDIFRTADLTPFVILASLLTAVVIGAGHALTPGHGKTLMAAYLVGSRGTSIHAVGLGLSVAVSHTLGIFALALIIVGAGSVLPPDVVYRVTPIIAGASIVLIGGWMLLGELRRRRAASRAVGGSVGAESHDHEHEHAGHVNHDAGATHEHPHAAAHEHDHPHPHGAAHEHEHPPAAAHEHTHDLTSDLDPVPGEHSHGGVRHSHLPAAGTTLTWRGLFVLGLAGGLIPSTSALLILLGSIAAGRPAFGLVLVIAFGLGMAAVMTSVGLAMIVARTRLDRMPSRSSLGRLAAVAPLVASIAVLTLGLVLTWQAVAGSPVL